MLRGRTWVEFIDVWCPNKFKDEYGKDGQLEHNKKKCKYCLKAIKWDKEKQSKK